MEIIDQVFSLREANNPLIALESPLQERRRLLTSIAQECLNREMNCYLWAMEDDCLFSLSNSGDRLQLSQSFHYQALLPKTNTEHYFEILRFWKQTELKGILIIEGIFPWINEPNPDPDFFLTSSWIKSALINLKLNNFNLDKTAILLGANATLTPDIAPEIPVIVQGFPQEWEIYTHIAKSLCNFDAKESELEELTNACSGMYLADVEAAFALCSGLCLVEQILPKILEYKTSLFKRTYSIDFLPPPNVEIGGLELMQSAFKRYKRLTTPLAKAYNLRLPKGVLLVGPPGTGKTHSAKACSQQLGVPLIILEWGSFRSFGNQAEHKLKKLLARADRINDVILYLDDFDKGFAGDDDLSKRLAGILLTWMQERTSDVVVIASANRLEWLPPELTRCGRFDDIFKVDLPNNGERHLIFKIHLSRFDKRFKDGDSFTHEEWSRLLKETYRCVGAEIQTIVERAAASTFCQMFPTDKPISSVASVPLEITLSSLLKARESINPLAIREADKVEAMRNKATVQGLPSSSDDSSIYSLGNINMFD
ncbi:ATP-binding protein [Nostoc sp. MG11]|uniref:ATP-binding protein n=1 Tax=Nostoc sp. MG11 TaxID=2721166 RepID=UPI001868B0B1|nr:ATP-binding protein [Nostoc sp. MG11]